MFKPQDEKRSIRQEARKLRRQVEQKEGVSRQVVTQLSSLTAYQRATSILFYISSDKEVQTTELLESKLDSEIQVVVPYCVDGDLELYELSNMDDLSRGAYNLLEPKIELRHSTEKRVLPSSLDLVLVPGVAFDRRGARLGQGKGYYDRLLKRCDVNTVLIGLGFDCQMFDKIPTEPHDIRLDIIVTEKNVYP